MTEALHQPGMKVPLGLVTEILEHLLPHDQEGNISLRSGLDEGGPKALANCAQACRAFQQPALDVLWREQTLKTACSAPLLDAARVTIFKGYDNESEDEDGDGPWNNDWPVGLGVDDTLHVYLDGPLTPAQWSRFQYYAQFVRVLRHDAGDVVSPSVFLFLQHHAHGAPLFPNVRTVVWGHAAPELLAVLARSVQTLRLPFDADAELHANFMQPRELVYRAQRHAFKSLLPSMLRATPALRTLALRPLRHEGFWRRLAQGASVLQTLRRLHITEPLPVLLRGALPVVATLEGLEELRISVDSPVLEPEPDPAGIPLEAPLRPLTSLRRLRIDASEAALAFLLDALDAPALAAADLRFQAGWAVDRVTGALRTLCTRNAGTLRVLRLAFAEPYAPRRVPAAAADSPVARLLSPVREARGLRELVVDFRSPKAPFDVPFATLLAAWPVLECLDVPVLSLTPACLRTDVRLCPRLRRLRGMCLSDDFVEAMNALDKTPDSPPAGGHPLRELRLSKPRKVAGRADELAVARFLWAAFPQLRVEDCVEDEDNRAHDEGWATILAEVARLQRASGSGVA